MTPEQKVALLKDAGVWDVIGFPGCIEKLIALVAAHEKKFWMEQIEVECNEAVLAEREECAKVCESFKAKMDAGIEHVAAAIRARSNNG